VYADQVRGSKFERSQPFRAAAEAGNLKLLRGSWNETFLEECEQFSPDEREYEHDDQVDAPAERSTTSPRRNPTNTLRFLDTLSAPMRYAMTGTTISRGLGKTAVFASAQGTW
jgi:hypothetical protein